MFKLLPDPVVPFILGREKPGGPRQGLSATAQGILNTASAFTLAALPVGLAAVQADLASVVHRALEPAHVTLWTNDRR